MRVDDRRPLERLRARGWAAPPLWGLSQLYALMSWGRNRAYDRGWLGSFQGNVPVISVGSLEAGGLGKTPIVRCLADLLLSFQNPRLLPTILSRGYGGSLRQFPHRVSGLESPELVGDEIILLKHWLPEADILVSPDRRAVFPLSGPHRRVCLLDDGFQHRQLRRDLDIVVMSERADSRLLPWGNGRETIKSLARAHVLWLHHALPTRAREAEFSLAASPPELLFVRSDYVLNGLLPLNCFFSGDDRLGLVRNLQPEGGEGDGAGSPVDNIPAGPVWVVAGIAHPERVVDLLRASGLAVAGATYLPDHHWYGRATCLDIELLARANGARAIVSTEKDGVKLKALTKHLQIPWYLMQIKVRILEGEEALKSRIRALVSSETGNSS